jgi:uncharacterized protein YjiS (DUF1127 family)
MIRALAHLTPLVLALPRPGRWLERRLALRRQRNRLLDLDARMLDDIGVTPSEAMREARRLMWDVPDRWRR